MDEFFKKLSEEYNRKKAIQRELKKVEKEESTIIDDEGNELIFERDKPDPCKPIQPGFKVSNIDDMKVDISKELEWLEANKKKKDAEDVANRWMRILFGRKKTTKKDNSPWISTEDKLPETDDPVLIRLENGTYRTGQYGYLFGLPIGNKCWFSMNELATYADKDITHWMEIPVIPKI